MEKELNKMSKKKSKTNIKRNFKYLIGIVTPLIVLFIFLKTVISIRVVPTESMENTILCNDITFSNLLAFKNRNIERTDIVLAKHDNKIIIKRVIGLPGDTISFSNDTVYVNGSPLNEQYLADGMKTTSNTSSFTLKSNEYFLMGDNRINSLDSRMCGAINKTNIVGRTFFIFGFSGGFHFKFC